MNFGEVIESIKQGNKCARSGWNGNGMWLSYSPGSESLAASNFWSQANREYAEANGGFAKVGECITFKGADGVIAMGWRPTSADMFATDWHVV